MRVRNLKLLISDVFKQFDLLFKEIDLQERYDKQEKEKRPDFVEKAVSINLGELQADSVQSFTDLLYMPQIDKKLIQALGDFMFRISNFSYSKNQKKNQ